ncbi:MAG: helix-turn-helix domain-containing protein, partial [Erysipelotrichaceae bacterium]|nr:helix-turn-helix domain-containing protein [Erysipelotrichaceae bacterium]
TKIYARAGDTIKKLEFAIKNALKQKKMTQKEYAESICLAESTFSNYVKGAREMNYQMLSKIAEDLSLDLNAIFKSSTIDKKSNMITETEANIINAFRQVPKDQQAEIAISIISLLRLSKKLDK